MIFGKSENTGFAPKNDTYVTYSKKPSCMVLNSEAEMHNTRMKDFFNSGDFTTFIFQEKVPKKSIMKGKIFKRINTLPW